MRRSYHVFLCGWLPVFLWMTFIFILSSVPGEEIPNLSIPFFHKLVHFVEYSILGALWVRGFLLSWPSLGYFKVSSMVWGLSALFAITDEWHQTFTPGRSGKLEDVLFDFLCALFGILIYLHGRFAQDRKFRFPGGGILMRIVRAWNL